MDPRDSDSDSAPEDVAFKDAKEDAMAHLKTVSEAAKQKKKLRKEQIKKRQEHLAEQKQIKKQKLEELESKKLPFSVLDDLEETGDDAEPEQSQNKRKPPVENSRIVFDDQEKGSSDEEGNEDHSDCEDSGSENFIALKTNRTNFKVVTSTDLKSSKFKSSEAYSFREKMLFGSRVRREPHKNQILRKEKLKVTGLSQKITSQ